MPGMKLVKDEVGRSVQRTCPAARDFAGNEIFRIARIYPGNMAPWNDVRRAHPKDAGLIWFESV